MTPILQTNMQQQEQVDEALVDRLDKMNVQVSTQKNPPKEASPGTTSKIIRTSESETSASTQSNEEKTSPHQPQQQHQHQEELREAIDKEVEELKLPKTEHQLRKQRIADRNELIPDTIVVTSKDCDDDDDDDLDNCSLISGLTLPQEIVLLRTIADTTRKTKKTKTKKIETSVKKKKTKNKVQTTTKKRRPTIDEGDVQPNRAQDMEINIVMNGQVLRGSYSGALSHSAPRKPNGVGVIKFDNGDMYMGDVKDGQIHGQGTLVNGDTVLRGDFEHNMFVV